VRLAAALLLSILTCGAAVAAADLMAERRATMKSFAAAARTIGDMFAGKTPYDAGRFKSAAEFIRDRSGGSLRDAFPAGSIGGGSLAKPEIFAESPDFGRRADQLALLAAALARSAERSPERIGDHMRTKKGTPMLGGLLASREKPLTETEISSLPAEHVFHLMIEQCTACHARFRAPD
jgi:cytochrome c556